jgi:hypothetical protein
MHKQFGQIPSPKPYAASEIADAARHVERLLHDDLDSDTPKDSDRSSPAQGKVWFLKIKPITSDVCSDRDPLDCKRVAERLLYGFGPFMVSPEMVGDLNIRYLVPGRPPAVPTSASTMDVCIMIDLCLSAATGAFHALEDNCWNVGLEIAMNEQGVKLSWRRETRTEYRALMVLESLYDARRIAGGRNRPALTVGPISGLSIPQLSIVLSLYQTLEIYADFLDDSSLAIEHKDATHFGYRVVHPPGGGGPVAASFRRVLSGSHKGVARKALDTLRWRFADDETSERLYKGGPTAVVKFEIGGQAIPDKREAGVLRQPQASAAIDRLHSELG